MAEITAALVKDLREKTGVGMMDCKKALAETNGDLEAAVDWLRAKGLSKAAKKADRAAAEGVVAVALAGRKAAVVELNSDTDFVARNADFQKAAGDFSKLALEAADHEALLGAAYGGAKVSDAVTNLIATIGENIALRRSAVLAVQEGVVAAYVHGKVDGSESIGRMGVLVALESAGAKPALEALGKKLAMHIASTAPLALTEAEIPAERVAILRTGEGVFTPEQMSRLAPSGGGITVNIQNNTDAQVTARQGDDGMSIEVLIERVEERMASNMTSGRGSLGNAVQNRFGLRAQAQ